MFALADCNNFFASCERVFRPELNGKPVIVLSNNDGCVVARSNEAKALGIQMGVPFFKVRPLVERCGVAVFSSNFALYGDMSHRVQEVLSHYAPAVEVYSIDECFLDLRGLEADWDAYAKALSRRCRRLTAIPLSVGVAPTKTLAKIASKLCKHYPKLQGGCYLHRPQDIEKVLRAFPVEDVWGIGRRSVPKLADMHVRTAWEYAQLPETTVRKIFALPGFHTWKELRGVPCIEFEDWAEPKQSICVSRSFAHEIRELPELLEQVTSFAGRAVEKLRNQASLAGEMMVFALTNRFKDDQAQSFDSQLLTFPEATNDYRTLVTAAARMARSLRRPGYAYKKAGVVLRGIEQVADHVPSLFRDVSAAEKDGRLSRTIDQIHQSFGGESLLFGIQGDGRFHMAQEHKSPHYTTLWADIPHASVK